MVEVSLFLSCHDASADMEHDLPTWVIYQVTSFDRTEVKLSNLPFGVKMHTYVSMHLDARNTMAFPFSTFLGSKVICKNVDLTKQQHFCLTFPGKVKMRPNVVKSGMVGFRTSQTFRSPLLRNSIIILGANELGGGGHNQVRSRMAK